MFAGAFSIACPMTTSISALRFEKGIWLVRHKRLHSPYSKHVLARLTRQASLSVLDVPRAQACLMSAAHRLTEPDLGGLVRRKCLSGARSHRSIPPLKLPLKPVLLRPFIWIFAVLKLCAFYSDIAYTLPLPKTSMNG